MKPGLWKFISNKYKLGIYKFTLRKPKHERMWMLDNLQGFFSFKNCKLQFRVPETSFWRPNRGFEAFKISRTVENYHSSFIGSFIDVKASVFMCIVSTWSRVLQFFCRWQVVLCFSPVGSTLRVRSRKFPAVTNCTAIDWFHEWPQEALVSVSKRFIDDLEQLEVRRIFFTSVD